MLPLSVTKKALLGADWRETYAAQAFHFERCAPPLSTGHSNYNICVKWSILEKEVWKPKEYKYGFYILQMNNAIYSDYVFCCISVQEKNKREKTKMKKYIRL